MDYEFSIESAVKSIFLYCMNDSRIREELMKGCGSKTVNYIEKADIDRIEEKIDEISFLIKNLKDSGNLDKTIPQKKLETDKTTAVHFPWARKESYEDITTLEKENKRLKIQLNNMAEEKRSIENANEGLKNKINSIEKRYQDYAEIVTIWENLNTLSDNAKNYITSLCGSFNLYSCISLGRDEGKIGQLWDYLKNQALALKIDEDNSDIEKLDQYFGFCLKVANSITTSQSLFVRFEMPAGTNYDMEKCIKTVVSKQLGLIKKTIIKGVKKSEKVIYKSIVEVR